MAECVIARSDESTMDTHDITIVTSACRDAGTWACVYVSIDGELGSTGERALGAGHAARFQRGRRDVFQLRSRSLGTVRSVRLRHDGADAASAWKVESVSVALVPTGAAVYFACNRWLDANRPGCSSSCTLSEPSPAEPASRSFHVRVRTAAMPSAGTDGAVFLTLLGAAGDTGPLELSRAMLVPKPSADSDADGLKSNDGAIFKPGRVDMFELRAPDVRMSAHASTCVHMHMPVHGCTPCVRSCVFASWVDIGK